MVEWKDENEKGREKRENKTKEFEKGITKNLGREKERKQKKRKINVNALFKILCTCTTTKTQ